MLEVLLVDELVLEVELVDDEVLVLELLELSVVDELLLDESLVDVEELLELDEVLELEDVLDVELLEEEELLLDVDEVLLVDVPGAVGVALLSQATTANVSNSPNAKADARRTGNSDFIASPMALGSRFRPVPPPDRTSWIIHPPVKAITTRDR